MVFIYVSWLSLIIELAKRIAGLIKVILVLSWNWRISEETFLLITY